jgi:uncharacterized protein YdeI (YjbR/CyaY-like superfamily)
LFFVTTIIKPLIIKQLNSMANKSISITSYINKSAAFAQPILSHLRELVHNTCPQVEEKIKWGFPHFDYKGEMMCSMAAFKQHASFGFWKAAIMKDPELLATAQSEVAMGHIGRITSLNDLPSDKKLVAWIKDAMELNENGIKLPAKPKSTEKKILIVPDYFVAALQNNQQALLIFESSSYSHKKEYVEWITDAKTEITRQKRIDKAIEMIATGKGRNHQYETKK